MLFLSYIKFPRILGSISGLSMLSHNHSVSEPLPYCFSYHCLCNLFKYLVTYIEEEEMATRSRILAWRIPQTEAPGGLQSTGSQRARHGLRLLSTHVCMQPASWLSFFKMFFHIWILILPK